MKIEINITAGEIRRIETAFSLYRALGRDARKFTVYNKILEAVESSKSRRKAKV